MTSLSPKHSCLVSISGLRRLLQSFHTTVSLISCCLSGSYSNSSSKCPSLLPLLPEIPDIILFWSYLWCMTFYSLLYLWRFAMYATWRQCSHCFICISPTALFTIFCIVVSQQPLAECMIMNITVEKDLIDL